MVSDELATILKRHGRKHDFCTCRCSSCQGRTQITTRQALHSIMEADLADAIIADQGPAWAIVAALADPRGDGTSARQALVEISRAGISFERPQRKLQAN